MTTRRALAVAALLIAGTAATVTGCAADSPAVDDQSTSSGLATPLEVVVDFSSAVEAHDCDQMAALVVPGQKIADMLISSCRSDSGDSSADASLTVVSEQTDGDTAVVQAKDAEGRVGDIELTRENADSAWLIDLTATAQKSLGTATAQPSPEN
ncbi:hypothetical protein F8O07_06900 [Pseudoclavibacter sp. CFCC 13796]|uniref:hypothetical protein n=1 Tax=Pseudoclavibacter sp. CFCC 13796 TaxID=2615179 RepID=UPI001300FD99|nr:hypothetical protein [Pseudoclavibacter sp. CFCC 13796]KAB1661627.1 hypothetical protein F8O07_06900 [Pseudoclavibacter sp. CFCC 13796]